MKCGFRIMFAAMSLAIGFATSNGHAQDYRYAVIELHALDGIFAGPDAINDHGELVGLSDVDDGALYHATLWDIHGIPMDLGAFEGQVSSAKDINELAEVVGWSGVTVFGDQHAVLWRNGEMIELGTLGGQESEAFAINESSQVVGAADTFDGREAFIWEDGNMSALPPLGQSGAVAFDINNRGQMVGESVNNDGRKKAVLWENQQIIDLPTLERDPSAATAINELGQIVGQSKKTVDNTHAVAWINGQIFDLHRSSLGPSSAAWEVNDRGQVVGWVGVPPTNQRGFLWEAQGGMRTINSLAPPLLRENWVFSMAWDVNEAGQIAVGGHIGQRVGTLYAFVVTPVYPTMNLSAPAPGIAGEMNSLTINGVTPGERVYFYYSRHGGGARIPGCDLQQNALQLDRPKLIGSAIADGNGIASVSKMVPSAAQGQWILMQAVVPGECAISQLVVWRFE